MTTNFNEEIDLDSMSEEELDTYMTQIENGETNVDSSPVQEEPIQTSDENTDVEAQTEETEESNPEQEETEPVLEGDDVPEAYKGKTAKDLLEMQKQANTKISQQNNEIYQMRKQLESLQAQQNALNDKAIKNADDELLASYQQDDIDAINRIIERKLQEREQASVNASLIEKESIAKEHDEIWANLETFNPQLFYSIKETAMQTMVQDPDNTYHKKGWLKQFIATQAQQSMQETQGVPPSVDKSKLKRRAVTVGSGAKVNSRTINKSLDEMSMEEYEAHMKAQGISF